MPVQIDIETLGVTTISTVIQIGAVKFNYGDSTYSEKFIVDVDPESCRRIGGMDDKSTVEWWGNLGGFKPATDYVLPIKEALEKLNGFLKNSGNDDVWCKGPHFDIAILEFYYDKLKIKKPWKYNKIRDFRTIEQLHYEAYGYWAPDVGEPSHRADEDCDNQIKALKYYLKKFAPISNSDFKHDPVLSEKLIGKPSNNPVSTVEVVDTTPDYRKRYEDE